MQSHSSYRNVYIQLVKACPSAREVFSVENQVMPPARLATDFANHLLELYRVGHTEEFTSLAIQIEQFYRLTHQTVREWATLGLLESILTVWERTEIDPAQFRRYLLPQSQRDWDRLASFWSETKSHGF
jgi:hypothetical protein